jgi:hypothetical protein
MTPESFFFLFLAKMNLAGVCLLSFEKETDSGGTPEVVSRISVRKLQSTPKTVHPN